MTREIYTHMRHNDTLALAPSLYDVTRPMRPVYPSVRLSVRLYLLLYSKTQTCKAQNNDM